MAPTPTTVTFLSARPAAMGVRVEVLSLSSCPANRTCPVLGFTIWCGSRAYAQKEHPAWSGLTVVAFVLNEQADDSEDLWVDLDCERILVSTDFQCR
jgi:hypothetical protein